MADPCQQARTPRTCMWRKKGEKLHQECSTKDKKERTVGHMAKFMIECFPYDGNINGELFSQFVRDRFSHFFQEGE